MRDMIIMRIFTLCVLILICYIPGLSGGFLFDDFANLDALGKYGGINNLGDLWSYLTKGIAGPGGRPLSLLSFLANSTEWPTHPWPFKVTNLGLHVAVAMILYGLIYRLMLLLDGAKGQKRAMDIAWLATALWALHPYFVSTTLYVVQRMTILATLFVIIGLFTYIHGRSLLPNRPRAAYIWMTLGLGINTILAVLSKENGILLPLLALVVEYSILRHQRCLLPRPSKIWEAAILWIPASSIFIYILVKWPGILHGYNIRPFDLSERLLTEGKIIAEYLYHLAIPKMQTRGLFNDNYPVISSITDLQAIISISFLSLLLVTAIALRKTHPFVTLSILFFLAGHIIESTVIPLELYFEHRNYMPATLFFIPLAVWVYKLAEKDKRLFYTASASIILLLTSLTTARSDLWGDSDTQMLVWAEQNPTSQRAQRSAAIALYNKGNHIQAIRLLEHAEKQIPDSLPIRLHLFIYKCHEVTTDSDIYQRWIEELKPLPYDFRTYNLLEGFITLIATNQCKGLSKKEGHTFLDMLSKKPELERFPSAINQLSHLRGLLYSYEHKPAEALTSFKQSLKTAPNNIESGFMGTAILATNGHTAQALDLLKYTEDTLGTLGESGLKRSKAAYNKEIVILRNTLLKELAQKRP